MILPQLSGIFFFEFLHEFDQSFDALVRHRVVNGSAHTADGAVPFQVDKTGRFRFFHEFGVQLVAVGHKRNVHKRTVLRHNRAVEHFAVVQIIIQKFCLFYVAFLHSGKTAVFFQPFEYQFADVNGVAGGRVVKRIVVRLDLIVEHGRRDVTRFAKQIFADNADGKTCGGDILLCTTVNHTEFCNIQRLRQEAGGNIRNQRHVAGVGQFVINRAVNGVIHADIEIICVRRKGGFVKFRNFG